MFLKAAGGKWGKLLFLRELSKLIIFKFELKARLDESEEEEEEGEAVDKEGGSDFTGVTVEAWTSFNRLERLTKTRKI